MREKQFNHNKHVSNKYLSFTGSHIHKWAIEFHWNGAGDCHEAMVLRTPIGCKTEYATSDIHSLINPADMEMLLPPLPKSTVTL